MVAQLLRLKLRLLLNSTRRSPAQLISRGLAILLGVLALVWAVRSLVVALAESDSSAVHNNFILVAALVSLGFLLLPLLFSREDSLDPRRLALFGMTDRALAFAILVAALISIPIVLLTIAAFASVFALAESSSLFAATLALGILALVVGVASCVLFARFGSALSSLLLDSRRARSVGASLALLLVVVAAPVIVLLATQDWKNDGQNVLGELAAVAAWTPFGVAWAVPADVAEGEWPTALLRLLVSVLVLGLLWLLWQALVARMLVTPGRTETQRGARGLGWFDRFPHGPTGAVAARSFSYWTRDPRYWVSVAIIPIAPILVTIPLLIAGVSGTQLTLLPVPFMCLFIGWAIHNDVAYDGSAVWLHVASGMRGLTDRVGRLIPILISGIVVIGLGSAISVAIYGDWGVLPSMLGVSTALLLVGLGISSYTSARFPYAVSKPGDGAFTQPQNSAGGSTSAQALSLLATVLLATPAIVFAVLGLIQDPSWHMASLASGVGIGLIVLVGGVWWGSVTFERRGPEMLAAALRS